MRAESRTLKRSIKSHISDNNRNKKRYANHKTPIEQAMKLVILCESNFKLMSGRLSGFT